MPVPRGTKFPGRYSPPPWRCCKCGQMLGPAEFFVRTGGDGRLRRQRSDCRACVRNPPVRTATEPGELPCPVCVAAGNVPQSVLRTHQSYVAHLWSAHKARIGDLTPKPPKARKPRKQQAKAPTVKQPRAKAAPKKPKIRFTRLRVFRLCVQCRIPKRAMDIHYPEFCIYCAGLPAGEAI